MSKEKSAFPTGEQFQEAVNSTIKDLDRLLPDGITYRQYLVARVYPKVMEFIWLNDNRLNAFKGSLQEAAELTWQAVDALIEAEKNNDRE